MAQRRMFSLKIVSSDAFLEMPTSSRELYFQLGMYADDDGFVNPRKIMRMIGASDDDLKVLLSKRFLLSFENGVVVVKHWLINNLVRKDFYQPTIYLEEKERLEIKENKSYTENVNNLLPQDRIGKDRLLSDSTNRKVNSKNMGWKSHNENDHTDDIPSIDADSGEKIRDKADEQKEESKKISHNLGVLGEARGKKFLDIPTQRSFYIRLLKAGLTHRDIGKQFMDLVDSSYWVEKKKQGQLPDLKSLYSIVKNKT